MTNTKQFQLGSISTGTLCTEDLLPAFADTLWRVSRGMDSAGAVKLIEEANDILSSDLTDFDAYGEDIIRGIEAALQEFCPPFVYFGAHPDDGADFGFWADWDTLQPEIDQHKEWGHDKFWLDEYQCMVEVSYPNSLNPPVTVLDANGNVLWSTV